LVRMSIYERLLKKEEEKVELPKKERHKITAWIGHCKDCDKVMIHGDIGKLTSPALLDLAANVIKRVREERKDWPFLCSTCGFPVAQTKEAASELEACPLCGGTRAVRIARGEKA